ncbi:MAG: tRNA dihydrouridine synthase DusB [Lachnospiraceae bacterium]|nr:tRNA dihydrouridine synthase DusB [Lachnospiraceae bacterium]
MEQTQKNNTIMIGDVPIAGRYVLGPMAGVTDQPFRILCMEQGASLVSMEMVSANAVTHGNKKTLSLIHIGAKEHPISMQLFGPDADTCARAAERLHQMPFDILDFNMGCPMPKIVNNNEGSALMRDIPRAQAIIRALKNATDRPVTVKIRKGFCDEEVNAVEAALALEDAGADAIAVHGRTREQYYAGKADWDIIRRVKEAVKIPVIGNGDVFRPEDAEAMMRETGCDLVMIARGARGNPWIFRDCLYYERTGGHLPKPSIPEAKELMMRHARMQLAEKGDHLGILQMRKHIAWYTAGYRNSAALRSRINSVKTFDELSSVLEAWAEEG